MCFAAPAKLEWGFQCRQYLMFAAHSDRGMYHFFVWALTFMPRQFIQGHASSQFEVKRLEKSFHRPPPYAIISHRWGDESEEVLLIDISDRVRAQLQSKGHGYKKICVPEPWRCKIASTTFGCIRVASIKETAENLGRRCRGGIISRRSAIPTCTSATHPNSLDVD